MSTKTYELRHKTPCATCGGKGPHAGTAGHPYVAKAPINPRHTIFSDEDIAAFLAGVRAEDAPDTVRTA
jgi:hypothetical protein